MVDPGFDLIGRDDQHRGTLSFSDSHDLAERRPADLPRGLRDGLRSGF